jgi:hypothetical protein
LNASVLKALLADDSAWTLVQAPRVREPLLHVSMTMAIAAGE